MKLFDCACDWRFLVGRKQVYGPIYAIGLPGHFLGPSGCHTPGRMMSREQFEDQYSDCAYRFGHPLVTTAHPAPSRFCYAPHFDRHDHGLPNPDYQPHVHVPATDKRGRPVAVIWEDK